MPVGYLVTHGLGNFGGGGAVTPITLSVSDNANGTGGVATINGSQGGTVTVYSLVNGGSSWVSQGTRSGDGTLAVTPGDGTYWWYAVENSIISNLVLRSLTGSAAVAPIESVFQQLLRDNSAVTALVGTRIHAGHRIQRDALPAINIRKLESGDDHTISHDENWRQPKVIVEVYAADYYAADTLSELIRDLEDTLGIVTVKKVDLTTYRALEIVLIEIEDEDLDSPAPPDGSDNWTEKRAFLFNVICQRPS